MVSVAELTLLIQGKDDASKVLKGVKDEAGGLGKALGDVSKIAGGFVIAQGLLKLPGLIGGAMSAASNLNETVSKSNTVFKDAGPAVEQWASTAAKAFGQSKQQALEAAGSFGNMFSQLGIGSPAAADMSMKMTALASDFASFHNADITEVLQAQQAAFRGEYDALQRFVPTINAAAVETEALAETGKQNAKELTAQEKATATYHLMLKGAGDAMGDFSRTADGAANKQRILDARMADLSATIGKKLLPVKVALMEIVLDKLIPAFETLWGWTSKLIDGPLSKLASLSWDALKEHLLPPLEKLADWFKNNTDAMQAAGVAIGAVLVVAFTAWAVAAGAAAIATIAAAAPVIAIVAVIALLAAGIFLLIKHWDEITAKYPVLGAATEAVKEKFQAFASWITGSFVPAVLAIYEGVKEAVEKAVAFVRDHWDEIRAIIEPAVKAMALIVEAAWNQMRIYIETAIGVIQGIVDVFMGVFTGDWDRAWGGVKQIVESIWNGIKETIENAIGLIKGLAPLILDAGKALGGALLDGLKEALSATAGFAGDVASAVLDAVKRVINEYVIDKINSTLEFSFDTHIPGVGSIHINPPDIPHLAGGGIVTRPTLALIGEAGPEAVVPLSRGGGGVGGFAATVQFLGPVTIQAQDRAAAERSMGDAAYGLMVALRARGAA